MGLQKARRLSAFCQNQALPPFGFPEAASTLEVVTSQGAKHKGGLGLPCLVRDPLKARRRRQE